MENKKDSEIFGVFEDGVFVKISEDDPMYEIYNALNNKTLEIILNPNNISQESTISIFEKFTKEWFID